jgi:hypothetical protein
MQLAGAIPPAFSEIIRLIMARYNEISACRLPLMVSPASKLHA